MKNTCTLNAAFIATYPPRKCGIGTFTYDLAHSIEKLNGLEQETKKKFQIIAMHDLKEKYAFPPEVHFVIRDRVKADYRECAEYLNLTNVDVICLQHEYGIFGGDDGNHILYLLQHLRKPVISTFHTVLEKPSESQKATLKKIADYSVRIVVLAEKASELLSEIYRISEEKIIMIPHGVPDVPFLDSSFYKERFQAEGRKLILTFGLLGPGKGMEHVIEALPAVVRNHPDALYIVLGTTHPGVKHEQGEKYRLSLESTVKKLGLQEHVVFHNQYVTPERLIEFIVASDIYITPYLSREQISSGTLSYAVACGKAVISTPYWYAEELLKNDRGLLVPFKDRQAMAETISRLLSNEALRNKLRKKAYQSGRSMIWEEVAKKYDHIFECASTEHGREKSSKSGYQTPVGSAVLPEIKLDHLRLMTDDTGILQHALYRTPNRHEGYTTDDNARALIVAVMHYHLTHDVSVLPLLNIYMSFINYAYNPNTKRMHNFMAYNRQWMDITGSEDCQGRTIWALGYTIWLAPGRAIMGLANHLFQEVIKSVLNFTSPRAWAFSIMGCCFYLQRFGGDIEVRQIIRNLAEKLSALYSRHLTNEWQWFENIVTYENARLSQGLIAAGNELSNETWINQGIESLKWLIDIQKNPSSDCLSIIGNSAWYEKGGIKSAFDQQPVDAWAFLDACLNAFEITGDKNWINEAERAFSWFMGKNDKNEALYDFKNGGCHDGLHRGGVSDNQGAESTLSCLASIYQMYQITHDTAVRLLNDSEHEQKKMNPITDNQ